MTRRRETMTIDEFWAMMEWLDQDVVDKLSEELFQYKTTATVSAEVDSTGRLDSESSPRFV